ncbi:hypothetical protein HBI56_139530 [Parastagonospora nodorum]|uniref:Uncharacterized protein n=1 Tax=Phaeosphaeria nodorum (strain SN15 / ATCC MYA-4574 / FGSC 10173) TaxID=321614 RepID=A0A7U2I9G2_PHANO|nr:hypothetical protein HBH56_128270 [Parastagonospora nodorum]QRD05678.1 hypothetical protein JI435_444770 [Parastagonospora nodorum SN15]KAH3931201.1 hypothetical protein HBH54_095210 [Parastagonospora nodorum]KAH3947196.1 hypothetical protein HBH53_118570 [Parastagonospora nodorum]KAH3970789.1 hypothetical protein HBH51_114980 [Parastagonospora nodorum]
MTLTTSYSAFHVDGSGPHEDLLTTLIRPVESLFARCTVYFREWRNERTAKRHYLENTQSNRLYRLPQELIDLITTQLDEVDYSSLQAACCCTPPPRIPFSAQGRAQFVARLHRDFLTRTEAREAATPQRWLTKLFCSSCMECHARSCFSPVNIIAPTFERICIGAAGRIRICEHATLTLEEIRKIPTFTFLQRVWRLVSGIPDPVYCGHPNHRQGIFSRAPEVDPTRNRISRIEYLPRVSYDRPLTAQMIREALTKRIMYICPHLTSDSERAISLLMQWSWLVEKGPDTRMQEGVDLRPQYGRMWQSNAIGKCLERDCFIKFAIGGSLLDQNLNIWIDREYGDLKSAQDPRWLAQIE